MALCPAGSCSHLVRVRVGVRVRVRLLPPDEVDRARLDERPVWVDEHVPDEHVHDGVDAVPLVVRDWAHGLLAHRALVGVPRRLVVVRVRDEAGAHAQDGERIDLHMRVARAGGEPPG
eukprot:scaffold8129_cov35-Phaeocystis_antarctica.AAC.1